MFDLQPLVTRKKYQINVFNPLMYLSLVSFQDLVELFNFHNYDNLRHFAKKHDPRREGGDQRVRKHSIML